MTSKQWNWYKESNTPDWAEFISWSCRPNAAVPFRWRLSAVIARSCWAPLMLLPWASITRTKGWASGLFSLGFNRNPGHVTQTARLGRCGDTPLFCHPLSSSWTPPSSPSSPLLPLFTAHYSVQRFQGGTRGGGRCWAFFVISSGCWPKTTEFVCWKCVETKRHRHLHIANFKYNVLMSF